MCIILLSNEFRNIFCACIWKERRPIFPKAALNPQKEQFPGAGGRGAGFAVWVPRRRRHALWDLAARDGLDLSDLVLPSHRAQDQTWRFQRSV